MAGKFLDTLTGASAILYFLLGILQMAAIVTGVAQWLGIPLIFAAILALIVGEIPILGTIAGVYGAVNYWGFSLLGGVALFGIPFALIVIISLVSRE